MLKPKLKQIFQVIGCGLSGLFFTSLALGFAYFENWLMTGIFAFFSFCGYGASYIFASKTQQQSRSKQ